MRLNFKAGGFEYFEYFRWLYCKCPIWPTEDLRDKQKQNKPWHPLGRRGKNSYCLARSCNINSYKDFWASRLPYSSCTWQVSQLSEPTRDRGRKGSRERIEEKRRRKRERRERGREGRRTRGGRGKGEKGGEEVEERDVVSRGYDSALVWRPPQTRSPAWHYLFGCCWAFRRGRLGGGSRSRGPVLCYSSSFLSPSSLPSCSQSSLTLSVFLPTPLLLWQRVILCNCESDETFLLFSSFCQVFRTLWHKRN